MYQSIRYGLRNVLNTKGRDSRRVFWPYQIAVSATGVLIELSSIAILNDAPSLQTDISLGAVASVGAMVATTLSVIALSLAACVRRLHDIGVGRGWAVVPLVSLATAYVLLAAMALGMPAGVAESLPRLLHVVIFACTMTFGLIGTVGSLWLLLLLFRKGSAGENRFGPPPKLPSTSSV